jgi:hypothetical protein
VPCLFDFLWLNSYKLICYILFMLAYAVQVFAFANDIVASIPLEMCIHTKLGEFVNSAFICCNSLLY